MISRRNLEKIVKPYRSKLIDVMASGWRDHQRCCSSAAHRETTRANAFRDHAVENARKILDGVAGIRLIDKGQLFLIGVLGKALLRIKKLDSQGRSKNIPTRQALQFQYQRSFRVAGFKRATNIDFGYELDSLEQGIARVVLSCPQGEQVAYTLPLMEGGGIVQLELPNASPASPAPAARRVHVRKPKAEEA